MRKHQESLKKKLNSILDATTAHFGNNSLIFFDLEKVAFCDTFHYENGVFFNLIGFQYNGWWILKPCADFISETI